MDNYGTHKTKAIRDWFAKRPRWQAHFTPTSASFEPGRALVRAADRQARSAVSSSAPPRKIRFDYIYTTIQGQWNPPAIAASNFKHRHRCARESASIVAVEECIERANWL